MMKKWSVMVLEKRLRSFRCTLSIWRLKYPGCGTMLSYLEGRVLLLESCLRDLGVSDEVS